VVAGGGVCVAVHEVPAEVGADIGRKIRMGGLEPVVHDGDDLVRAAAVGVQTVTMFTVLADVPPDWPVFRRCHC
jgi:hypothetical protein